MLNPLRLSLARICVKQCRMHLSHTWARAMVQILLFIFRCRQSVISLIFRIRNHYRQNFQKLPKDLRSAAGLAAVPVTRSQTCCSKMNLPYKIAPSHARMHETRRNKSRSSPQALPRESPPATLSWTIAAAGSVWAIRQPHQGRTPAGGTG